MGSTSILLPSSKQIYLIMQTIAQRFAHFRKQSTSRTSTTCENKEKIRESRKKQTLKNKSVGILISFTVRYAILSNNVFGAWCLWRSIDKSAAYVSHGCKIEIKDFLRVQDAKKIHKYCYILLQVAIRSEYCNLTDTSDH